MTTEIYNLTSAAQIKKQFIENIAPNYFNLDNVNTYRVGIFGYIDEIMSNSIEDTFNAINIIRKEFYPITASHKESFYKMATIQKIPLPMVTPATAKAVLVIPEKDIIEKGTITYETDTLSTFILDNTMIILADNIPFLLDYPIKILSNNVGGQWIHTTHYDFDLDNTPNSNPNRYITNKVIYENGTRYILLGINVRQVSLEIITELITKDATIDTVSINIPFLGDLANFEVFYHEANKSDIQLTKVLKGGIIPQVPFCYYTLLDDNTIQLTFPKNAYFTPAFNSELKVYIYTSLGSKGNFNVFKGSLTCQINSEKYPSNNNIMIMGVINGSSTGGIDRPTVDEFKNSIIKAYSTNNTITTSNDLQIYFDDLIKETAEYNKIVFKKKRDDALIRLFGAYVLLKDSSKNVIPTNTLNLNLTELDFDTFYEEESSLRGIIFPGKLYEYGPDGEGINYEIIPVNDLSIIDNLNIYDDNSRFLFTNPFLIAVTLNPNVVGIYLNSFDDVKPIEYKYVNDHTLIQFIGSSLKQTRDAIRGENFYRFALTISPSTDIDITDIIEINDPTIEGNQIRASQNGTVISCKYNEDSGCVIATIKYIDNTTADIIINNYAVKTDLGYDYITGYNMNFRVGENFVANDIIATMKDTDKGQIRVCADFRKYLFDNNLYIPFFIENYDETLNTFEIAAYIATNDFITSQSTFVITHGIYETDGEMAPSFSLPMSNLVMDIHIFYNNIIIGNIAHSYNTFDYVSQYTLTNTYTQNENEEEELIDLIKQIDFIRCDMRFNDHDSEDYDYSMYIKEIPLIKANWVKKANNFNYFINMIYNNYLALFSAYYLLENNFAIDYKFFNTYGKSKFFKVGIQNNSEVLTSVNTSFKFGIRLNAVSPSSTFISTVRRYIRNSIESLNSIDNTGQSIYILNLISALKSEFPEIEYIEYYGFNNYDHGVQKIQSRGITELTSDEIKNYIPEFININSVLESDDMVPDISILLLSE